MADDKDNLGQDFKKAVAEMAKANKDLKAASAELEKSGAMAEAGEAITKQFKGFKQTLGNSIIGAMGPLGGVTSTGSVFHQPSVSGAKTVRCPVTQPDFHPAG